jgi:hypothetical protein
LTSESAGPSGFDLQLVLSQVETDVPLGPEVFRVQIPASTDPITLEELKQGGPLAPRGKTRAEPGDPPRSGSLAVKPPAAAYDR